MVLPDQGVIINSFYSNKYVYLEVLFILLHVFLQREQQIITFDIILHYIIHYMLSKGTFAC